MARIYPFVETSGAHFNPAVTLGFAFIKRFEAIKIIPYSMAQLTGAFAATGFLKLLSPENQNLDSTIPSGSALQLFILEFILPCFLMNVIKEVCLCRTVLRNPYMKKSKGLLFQSTHSSSLLFVKRRFSLSRSHWIIFSALSSLLSESSCTRSFRGK